MSAVKCGPFLSRPQCVKISMKFIAFMAFVIGKIINSSPLDENADDIFRCIFVKMLTPFTDAYMRH